MYITPTDYNTYTGRDSSEATTLRIQIACKLLDSRIGNYPINEDGYKITDTFKVWCGGVLETLHQSKIDAVKMWCSKMVESLYINDNNPSSIKANNVSLGRFSMGGQSTNSMQTGVLPDEMAFVDNILISCGIINRRVKIR